MQPPKKPCRYCGELGHYPYKCFYKPMKNAKPCKFCSSSKHLSWQCFQNPNRLEQSKKKIKSGKVTVKWIITRKKWFKENPADHYVCYICGKWLTPEETTLDHVIPRSRAPHLRYEFSNLKPCCFVCNGEKGSKVYD